MARLERIRKRLDNWALWKARQNDCGLGYHERNILAVDVFLRGSYNGAIIPHFEEEAVETNEAVEVLKLGRGHLFVTLDWYYVKDLGVREIARRMLRSEATVHSQLEQADHAIAAWLDAKAIERERQRATAQAEEARKRSFTG